MEPEQGRDEEPEPDAELGQGEEPEPDESLAELELCETKMT